MWVDVWWGRGKSDATLLLAVCVTLSWRDGLYACHSLMSREKREVLADQPRYAGVSGRLGVCADISVVYNTHMVTE